jgi:hypothetical protein
MPSRRAQKQLYLYLYLYLYTSTSAYSIEDKQTLTKWKFELLAI